MEIFVLLASIAAFVFTWRAVVKWLDREGKGAIVRHILGLSAGIVVMFLVVLVFALIHEKEPTSGPLSSREQPASQEPVSPDLDMSLALYTKRLNRSFEENELPWSVNDAKFFKGEVNDSYTAPIGKYAVLSVSVTKKKQLVSVTVMTSGDGTKSSGYDVLLAASAALSAAAPRTELKDVLNAMPQLVSGESIDAGGVVFRAKNMDSLGLWFFAEPK